MMHSPPTIGSSLTATPSTPSSRDAWVTQDFMPIASNSSRIRCSNSTGLSASRSGRLSSPAMTFISSTNLYFDRSNCTTGRTASRS